MLIVGAIVPLVLFNIQHEQYIAWPFNCAAKSDSMR